MDLGLHLSNFTWPGGPQTLAADLGRVAKLAEDVGFRKLSVMDHVWQIEMVGPVEDPMLEAYTTLGYLAAKPSASSCWPGSPRRCTANLGCSPRR